MNPGRTPSPRDSIRKCYPQHPSVCSNHQFSLEQPHLPTASTTLRHRVTHRCHPPPRSYMRGIPLPLLLMVLLSGWRVFSRTPPRKERGLWQRDTRQPRRPLSPEATRCDFILIIVQSPSTTRRRRAMLGCLVDSLVLCLVAGCCPRRQRPSCRERGRGVLGKMGR